MTWAERLSRMDKMAFAELVLHIATELGVHHVAFSQGPMLQSAYYESLGAFRIDIVLSGRKHMRYPCNKIITDDILEPGDMICSPPGTSKFPCWDHPHEMCGLVLSPDLFRITYINLEVPQPVIDTSIQALHFYHLSQPPSDTCIKLLSILETEAAQGATQVMLQTLVTSLLIKLHEELVNDSQPTGSKSQLTWHHLKEYVQINAFAPITRKEIATHLHLNESYITYLFRKHRQQSLGDYIRDLRLDYARKLLENTDTSIYEITMLCGYQSSTSFIANFKKKFGLAPGKFRNIVQEKRMTE